MGSKISIDKHTSSLEDILDMSPYYFNKIKFENKIPENITQHIKIWRFFEEDKKSKAVRSEAVPLQNIQASNFSFLSTECYLLLLVYKNGVEDPSSFANFPHSMWGLVESYTNLTPRGLETPISSSQSVTTLNKEVLESFLMPKRFKSSTENSKFEYMIFVWNGRTSGPLIKSIALSTAFDLEAFINKAKDPLLQVLFSGGVIRNKKLQRGTILQLSSAPSKEAGNEFEKKFNSIKQTVYLFKFLFPTPPTQQDRKNACKNFNQFFLKKEEVSSDMNEASDISNERKEENLDSVSDEEQENRNETRPAQPVTHRGNQPVPSLALSFGNKAGGQQQNEPDKGHKAAKFMIPNLNLAKNLNQGDKEEELPTRGMRIGVDVHNTENKQGGNNKQVPEQTKDAGNAGKMKFSLNLANVNANRFGDESARERREVPNLNNVENARAANDRQIFEQKIEENSDETGRRSDETPEESSSQGDSSYRIEEPVRGRGFQLNNLPQNIKDIDKMTWEQIAAADQEDIEQMRESALRDVKIKHFSQVCNEIIPGFLYLGGETAAYNLENLEKIGITHVINTAADVCENKFPTKFKYLSFYQKDSKSESIECIFYDCIDFLEKSQNEKGKVLIHCVQGISRSVSVTIAYLILKNKLKYDQALDFVKKSRGIAGPNVGFVLQLLFFYKRLNEPFDSIPGNARVFCIGSHQIESPNYIVARMMIEQFYHPKNLTKLDPRTIFVVHTEKVIFKWIGDKIFEANLSAYEKAADEHIRRLQQYERGSKEVLTVKCGEEPEDFWRIWANAAPESRYVQNKEWNSWFIELSQAKDVTGTTYKRNEEDSEEEDLSKSRPNFFVYPSSEPIRNFEIDELSPDMLVLALIVKNKQKYCYFRKGEEFVPESDIDEETYFDDVVGKHWNTDAQNVIRIDEIPGDESSEFEEIFDLI